MTDLLLIRHGQANHNLEGRWEGWGPVPLTELGRRQARAVACRLAGWSPPITRLYTSPLLRAVQTAEPIALESGLEAITHDGLKEIDFGQVSGLSMQEFRQSMPDLFARWQNRADLTFQFPRGEQRLAFFQRVGEALDEILAANPGGQIVVVAHGGTLRAGLAHLFPRTMSDWWAYALGNASLTHVRVASAGNSLVALNQCQHLDAEAGS
jgi:broad specificity phosphatase PhoE